MDICARDAGINGLQEASSSQWFVPNANHLTGTSQEKIRQRGNKDGI